MDSGPPKVEEISPFSLFSFSPLPRRECQTHFYGLGGEGEGGKPQKEAPACIV